MIISFLQSLYDPTISLSWKEQQYEQVLQDIELFALSSQVYHLLNGRDNDRLPPSFMNKLRSKHMSGLHQNLFMKHKEEEAIRSLEAIGLPVIPLKGVHFAQRYFNHFAARVSSDVDLLVPLVRLDEAIECMSKLGYIYETTRDHHARMPDKNGLMMELHWTLDKQHWSDLHVEPFWQKAESLNGYRFVKQLSDLHTFYFICLHGARHQMDSLRYILDVVQMIHRCGPRLDYRELTAQAAQDKTYKRIQAVLSIVYRLFPHLQELKPLPFDMIETHWNYNVIRDAKLGVRTKNYYLYKFFFKHLIFDTFRHQMKSLHRAY
ncbi:nucleotidyltransferase family protein [Paenibacillus hamazuiensis]|uniref:nucleotidyltransferase family protein n=1 Tax=Paenibacillus hamazuiensis TaxID=2936508 RepID=UPI00200DA308|nr:nucleotidyltransferase family protein [Paenibacillus hamazuiensis]